MLSDISAWSHASGLPVLVRPVWYDAVLVTWCILRVFSLDTRLNTFVFLNIACSLIMLAVFIHCAC